MGGGEATGTDESHDSGDEEDDEDEPKGEFKDQFNREEKINWMTLEEWKVRAAG